MLVQAFLCYFRKYVDHSNLLEFLLRSLLIKTHALVLEDVWMVELIYQLQLL